MSFRTATRVSMTLWRRQASRSLSHLSNSIGNGTLLASPSTSSMQTGRQSKMIHKSTFASRALSSLSRPEGQQRLWEITLTSLLMLIGSASVAMSFWDNAHASVDSTSNVSIRPTAARRIVKETATGDKKHLPPKKPYDVSVRAIRGGRFTMEDEYFVGNGGRFAAVFDGHGGSGVSQFLRNQLYSNFIEALEQKHWEDDDNNVQQTPSVSSHVAALRAGFEKVERDVVADDDFEYQGSTAVAVLLHESDDGHRTLLSANVGDSRAILSRNGKAVDLTHDHKPNDEKEKARIMAMGETIEWDAQCMVHRVRNLSLSRAIGDRYAKPAVSSEVEIQHFPVQEGEDEFVIIASDGLWDVMSSQDAVDFVRNYMNNELSRTSKDNTENYKLVLRKNMAKFLAREAYRKGSSDNISVLMVWL